MATRDLSSAVAAALDDDVVYPFFAVDLMFEGEPQYLWTGIGTQTINGKDYEGLGELMAVSLVEETADIAAKGAQITISGIPKDTNVSLALNTAYQGRIGRIHFGVMGATTAYSEIFSGYMDEMNIVEAADTSSIEITIENKLVDLERPRVARYTSAYQKNKYAGDEGLDFVESLQNKEITWGRK